MKGFTLVELLVALAALAMLSALGVLVTGFAAGARDAVAAREAEATGLLRLRAALKGDLGQAAPRRARDIQGQKPQAALFGSDVVGDGVFLALVRRGWENLSADDRPDLQYVEYAVEGGELTRRHRRHVDGGELGPAQMLVGGVAEVDVSYFQFDQWVETFAGAPDRPLPRAVRVTLRFEDGSELSQSFILPASGP
jgi:type II secretion system protein J